MSRRFRDMNKWTGQSNAGWQNHQRPSYSGYYANRRSYQREPFSYRRTERVRTPSPVLVKRDAPPPNAYLEPRWRQYPQSTEPRPVTPEEAFVGCTYLRIDVNGVVTVTKTNIPYQSRPANVNHQEMDKETDKQEDRDAHPIQVNLEQLEKPRQSFPEYSRTPSYSAGMEQTRINRLYECNLMEETNESPEYFEEDSEAEEINKETSSERSFEMESSVDRCHPTTSQQLPAPRSLKRNISENLCETPVKKSLKNQVPVERVDLLEDILGKLNSQSKNEKKTVPLKYPCEKRNSFYK